MDMTQEGQRIALQDAQRSALAALPGEYLAFRVGGEGYGVAIGQVQEIRSWEPPTRVPGAPQHVLGVINLRGHIVPIVDLRLRLDCAEARCDSTTIVIVLAVADRTAGVVVDAVSDVVQLGAESIQPPPALAAGADAGHVTGIGTVGDRMLMLLDMTALVEGALGVAAA